MLYADTNTWCDFGDTKPSGKRVTGDALDLYVRVNGVTRGGVFHEIFQEMCDRALTELEQAAREGRGPARWERHLRRISGRDCFHDPVETEEAAAQQRPLNAALPPSRFNTPHIHVWCTLSV
jgi:hypothetical protein